MAEEDREFAILVSESDNDGVDFAEEIKIELAKRGSKVMVMHLYSRMEMDEIVDCLKDSFWPSNWIIIGKAARHIEPYLYNFMFVNPVFDLHNSLKQDKGNDMVSKIVESTGQTSFLSHNICKRIALFSYPDEENEKAFAEQYPGYSIEVHNDVHTPSLIACKAIEFFKNDKLFEKLPPMPGEKEPGYNPFELSKEEFLFLAGHRPEILIESVYEVRAYDVKPYFNGCHPRLPENYVRSDKHGDNFILSLEPASITYYSSIEKALAEMKNITGIQIGWEVHSVIIRRIPIDRYRNAPWLECWLFNGKGELTSRSVCSPYFDIQHEYISGRYMGRTESDLKFTVGDFVEVIYPDNYPHVAVGMVDKCPDNPEEVWENYKIRRAEAEANPEDFYEQEDYYDAIDLPGEDEDRYHVLFPDGNIDFIAPWRITNPTRPITDEIKKAFEHIIGKTPKFH